MFSITSDASTTFTVSSVSVVSRVGNAGGSPNDSVQQYWQQFANYRNRILFTPTSSSATYTVTPASPITVGANQTIRIFVIPNSLTASGTTSRVENNTSVTVTTTPLGGTPTQLAITSISPNPATVGSGFNVTVQAQDGTNVPANTTADTAFTLSNTGGGTIGGTTTGTITAGTNQVVVSGVTLSSAATGATLTATRTSGDSLTAGISSPFNVLAAADHLAFVNVPATGAVNGPLGSFAVEAQRPDNTVDTTYVGNILVSKATGSGTLTGTTTKAAIAGVATFNDLVFDTADTYTLNADSGSFTQITSGSIILTDSSLASDFFRSAATGDLGTAAIWESSHDGTTNWIAGTLARPRTLTRSRCSMDTL
ncbi:MAG: hypothetical protein IPN51_08840 [Chloracidobacterium sp.]|nr:hypothetical protein [Chloracidobacterium sp.]